MAQAIRAFQLPNKNILSIDRMARVSIFAEGVGIFDDRNRLIEWIEITEQTQGEIVTEILLELINNPRHAKQPDWSFLDEGTAAPALVSATMPARRASASGVSGNASSSGSSATTSTTATSST